VNEQNIAEWREHIGIRVMYAMRCAHTGDNFGPRAVCETCFESTQKIGALIENEVRAAYGHAEAEFMHAGQCSQMCEDHPETCVFNHRWTPADWRTTHPTTTEPEGGER
jgi:hypothetical protein